MGTLYYGDIRADLDSPVSLDYFGQGPFAFNGAIGRITIKDLKKWGSLMTPLCPVVKPN
ncbi:MAG: hypothetical protein IT579_21280 [Verrucomicrobia subdivision 3 bacterium]|nr:hypothetical protein [Limisphaerales bacterium]